MRLVDANVDSALNLSYWYLLYTVDNIPTSSTGKKIRYKSILQLHVKFITKCLKEAIDL